MTGTIVKTRPRTRPNPVPASTIREVCLIGSPRRTYLHISPEKPRSKE